MTEKIKFFKKICREMVPFGVLYSEKNFLEDFRLIYVM